jgi:hypothetical protein
MFSRSVKIDKNFFRQKNVTKKVFGGKNVTDFFTNYKIKKNLKILENIFWIFIFLKKTMIFLF